MNIPYVQGMKKGMLLVGLCLLSVASARPGVDRLGICYEFKAGRVVNRGACVISPGYGAGAQYVSYFFNNKEYYVEYPNTGPNMLPMLEGRPAIEYKRDMGFFSVLKGAPVSGETYIDCIKTKDGKIDLCIYEPGN